MLIARASRLRLMLCGLSTAALVAISAATMAPAAPLDEQTCDQLKREIVELEKLGTRDNLVKGAAWGKANLRSGQLEKVKKLIEMDEAVAFRCPRPKPQPAPAAAAPVQAKGKAPVKGAPKAKSTQEKVLAKPKPKPTPKPQATAESSPDAAAAQAKPRPKPPAPKAPAQRPASDAFVPPAKAAPAQ